MFSEEREDDLPRLVSGFPRYQSPQPVGERTHSKRIGNLRRAHERGRNGVDLRRCRIEQWRVVVVVSEVV